MLIKLISSFGCLSLGYGVGELFRDKNMEVVAIAFLIAAISFAVSLYMAVFTDDLNKGEK